MTTIDLISVSISSSCVCSAFRFLNPYKHDGTNLMSDHLILAEPAIEEFVATLFICILHHGYMPRVLCNCILVPIPKACKDPTSSNNYRSITLAPTLSKALEWSFLHILSILPPLISYWI